MADSDKTLEILIKLGVIGEADAKKAKELLEDTRNETEKFSLSTRESGHVLREVGESILPGAGRALSELRLGLLGLGLAAASVFEGIREQIAKTNEDFDKMGEQAAQAYADVKANLFDAIRDEEFPTEKIDKYFEHFQRSLDVAMKLNEENAKLQDASLSAEERKNKANEELDLARLKANPNLSPEQKGIAEAEIRKKYADLATQVEMAKNFLPVNQASDDLRDVQVAKAKLEIEKHNLETASDRERVEKAMASPDVDKNLKAEYEREKAAGTIDYSKIIGAANVKTAEQTVSSLKDKLGLDEKGNVTGGDAKTLKDTKEKLEPLIEQMGQAISTGSLGFGTGLGARKAAGMLTDDFSTPEAWAKAKANMEAQIEKAAASVKTDKDALAQEQTKLAIAKQTEEYNKKLNDEIDKLTKSVADAKAKFDAALKLAGTQNESAQAVNQIQDQTSLTAEAGRALGVDKSTADALRAGRGVSSDAVARMMADAAQIAGHQVNLQTAVQIIENGASNMGIFMNQIGRLTAVFGKFDLHQLDQLEHQIEVLESQINNGRMNISG